MENKICNPPMPPERSQYHDIAVKVKKEEVVKYFETHTEKETVKKFNLKTSRNIYRWRSELKEKTMKRKAFEFASGGVRDWVIAIDIEDAKRVYENECGGCGEPRELTEKEMNETYMLDPNKSEPDPDEVEYNEDDYCNGYLITGTFAEYLKDNGKYSHYLVSDEF